MKGCESGRRKHFPSSMPCYAITWARSILCALRESGVITWNRLSTAIARLCMSGHWMPSRISMQRVRITWVKPISIAWQGSDATISSRLSSVIARPCASGRCMPCPRIMLWPSAILAQRTRDALRGNAAEPQFRPCSASRGSPCLHVGGIPYRTSPGAA